MNNSSFLKGELVSLRALNLEDANGNYRFWLNDEEVCSGNSHFRFPYNVDLLREYINNVNSSKDKLVLGIEDVKNKFHIGNVSLQNINWISRNSEFAIIIGEKDYWSKGVGEESARLIIEHGFDKLNLERIYLGTYKNNVGMQKLAEKLGFVQEGLRRKADFKNGIYVDIIEYGLLKEEFKN